MPFRGGMRMAGKSHPLDCLFKPEAVAVVGSVKKGKIAHQIITQVVEGGYQGSLYAVNPKAEKPDGFPQVSGFSSIHEIGGPIDLSVICTPSHVVRQVIEECGGVKVPAAVVITSGFSEAGNGEGEREVLECARRYGIRIIGPNCAGIMNTGHSFFPSIEIRALAGRTAFITQSGAVGGAVLAMAKLRGIGFSKFVSFGNRSDVGENELLDYLRNDTDTDVIALYVESLQNGRMFMETARKVADTKPLLIIKAGRSGSGQRAAGSHTGSMAGSDKVFDSMVRQAGAIRVEGIEEMLDLCYGIHRLPPMGGNRIAIVTNSGGPGILTADRAEELRLDVKETYQSVQDKLRAFLPSHCAFTNPVDLTVEGSGENYQKTLEILLEAGYDGAIAINVATPFLDSVSLAGGIAGAVHSTEKPVAAVFMAGEIVEDGKEALEAKGVAHFPTGERAAYVFSKLSAYHGREKQRRTEVPGETRELSLRRPVLEPDGVRFLEGEGFCFPEHRFVQSPGDWETVVSGIGFPMVMKVVSPEILHKSDEGGVVLNIRDKDRLNSAFEEMRRKFSHCDFRGVMLYRQVGPSLEIIAGIKRDPDFGPVILAGAGGIYTELLEDVALRIAPIDKNQALVMLSELKISKRLYGGFRGGPVLDSEALAEMLSSLSRLAVTYPAIKELDLNPVFSLTKGYLIGDMRLLQ